MNDRQPPAPSSPHTSAVAPVGVPHGRIFIAAVAGLLAILLVAACGGEDSRDGSGAIVEPARIDAVSLVVGDCFDDDDSLVGEFESIDVLPCSQSHDNEVYASVDYPAANGEPYPGDDAIDEFADGSCFAAFLPYVGISYETSRLDYAWFAPTINGWEDSNDREVLCLLWDIEFLKLEGSMKDSRE